jgi:hypothetical protein
MNTPKIWWAGDARERFWLESTDRIDLGADLRAPLADDSGADNWRYTLFQQARIGDLVFHYDKRLAAITTVSRIAGPSVARPIVWAARGSYARERGAEPEEVPGYWVPLEDHRPLAQPLTLDALRGAAASVRAIHDEVKARVGGPLYFPFELSDRPIRPLQGYAFKLPADFVDAFPALRDLDGSTGAPIPAMGIEDQRRLFRQAIAAIEAAAVEYQMNDLQRMRARRRGLGRTARSIFGSRVQADDWAFHRGGRDELQFNVGLDVMADNAPAFRAGVAFSFEPSRSLPDPDVLLPKVARFNAWMRDHPEAFRDLSMWHYQGGLRSEDYAPGPIPAERVRRDTFVFLGHRQPVAAIDAHAALRAMDALLPLYEWAEAEGSSAAPLEETGPASNEIRMDGGRTINGGRWIKASLKARTLDIFLRHAELQRRLREALAAEGAGRIATEVPMGRCLIDLVVETPAGLIFYEVKTGGTVRACLREAIGQLLEYALWPGGVRPVGLVVVGEAGLDARAAQYIQTLNQTFPLPLSYRQVSLCDGGPIDAFP